MLGREAGAAAWAPASSEAKKREARRVFMGNQEGEGEIDSDCAGWSHGCEPEEVRSTSSRAPSGTEHGLCACDPHREANLGGEAARRAAARFAGLPHAAVCGRRERGSRRRDEATDAAEEDSKASDGAQRRHALCRSGALGRNGVCRLFTPVPFFVSPFFVSRADPVRLFLAWPFGLAFFAALTVRLSFTTQPQEQLL